MRFSGLYYFCVVAEEKSISKAAERLYLSQQALSGYISRLEKEYNCRLFERKPKFQLTLAGEEFYKFARNVTIQDSLIKERLKEQVKDDIRLPISISRNYEYAMLPPILELYRKIHPNVILSTLPYSRTQYKEYLQNLDVYCVFTFNIPKNASIQCTPLMQTSFCAVIYNSLLPAERVSCNGLQSIKFDELCRYPLILPTLGSELSRAMHQYCDEHDIPMNIRIETDSPEATMVYHKLGYGCCIIPDVSLAQLTKGTDLLTGSSVFKVVIPENIKLTTDFNLIYRSDINFPKYVLDFFDCSKYAFSNYRKLLE